MSALAIKEGDDVLAVIARAAPASAWVSGVGAIEDVEIALEGGADGSVRTVPERVTLLSLSGPAAGPIMVTFARGVEGGVQVWGGRLLRARSAGIAVIVVPGTLAVAERHAPGATGGRSGGSAGGRDGEPMNPWAALLQKPDSDEDETEEMPRPGDRVDHFVFGLCEVMVVRGDRMKIRDVNPPSRLREIHVGAVKMLAPADQDGHRVFKLVKRN